MSCPSSLVIFTVANVYYKVTSLIQRLNIWCPKLVQANIVVLPPQENAAHVWYKDKDLKLKRKRYTLLTIFQRLLFSLLDPIIDIGFGLFSFLTFWTH